MGAGGSLEAVHVLRQPVGNGPLRLVGDGIVLEAVDVTFEVVWRHGGAETSLARFEHHFEPLPGQAYEAQPFEATAEVSGVAAVAGDLIVLRFTGENSDLAMAYLPNGDGALTSGRIPFVDLPRD